MPVTVGDNVLTVSDALVAVMAELPGIGKDQTASSQQGGYAYRGIEQITQHVQPLFAKHGIVFAPRVEHYEIRDITVNNKPWTDTILSVAYDVYGPSGDHITVGPIVAIGRDNSDKGANKCMTQAFKYALLQVLCISDSKDDGDQASHEADAPRPPAWSLAKAKTLLVDLLGMERAGACWTANVTEGQLPDEDDVRLWASTWGGA